MSTTPSDNTPAGPTVGELIIHYLKLEGVTHVFGVPGGGLMNILVNLKNNDDSIKYVICRQETGAAYMADGYYRASGNMGVVVVTTGPGATNAVTGVMNAQADGSAVLLLSGEIDQQFDGKGYLQEGVDAILDVDAIYKAAVSYSVSISSSFNANTLMKQALRDILATPRQVAHISLPVNVTLETLASGTTLPTETSVYRTEHTGASSDEVYKALDSLISCKRPLLFLGNGCRNVLQDEETMEALLQVVEHLGIPVITTADAKGIFPESHDLSLRVYGMADCMWPYYYLYAEAPAYDGIVVIGSQLGELSTNKWSDILLPPVAGSPFIQVDINQKIIARSFEVTHGIVAEAGAFIRKMAGMLDKFQIDQTEVKDRKAFVRSIKYQHSPFFSPDDYKSESNPIKPQALMRVLQENLPEDSQIYIDAGNCVGWSVHYLEVDPPTKIFTSLSMGPMGFAVGAVVGAKLGSPESCCIAFTGDGAFMMQGSEISTAAQNNVGAIWLVLSDNNLSMVSQGMEHFKPDDSNPDIWRRLYELGDPDLVKYSEGLGADAYEVNAPSEFAEVMSKVLEGSENGKPQVIVVNIDREPVPPYYNKMYGPRPSSAE